MKPCARQLVILMTKAPSANLNAVYKKFCNTKHGEVARYAVPVLNEEEGEQL